MSLVGLVERLVVVKPGQTPPKREFAGTPSFCSLAAHNGEQPSAYDDLEAMVSVVLLRIIPINSCLYEYKITRCCFIIMQGFVLLSLTSGGLLPWSGSKSDSECKQIKQDCDIRKLCADSGVAEVADIILICRNASRTVRPNYDELATFLTRMRDRKVSYFVFFFLFTLYALLYSTTFHVVFIQNYNRHSTFVIRLFRLVIVKPQERCQKEKRKNLVQSALLRWRLCNPSRRLAQQHLRNVPLQKK